MNINVIGKNIRAERRKQDLSQENLGKLSNLSKNTICAIENGNQIPNAVNIYLIAKALNVDVNSFYTGIE